jgi:hypothetical protein
MKQANHRQGCCKILLCMKLLAAKNKYSSIKQGVFEDSSIEVHTLLGNVRFSLIDSAALNQFSRWAKHLRQVDWDWKQESEHCQAKSPSSLDVAVWKDGVLCGLCLARTSHKRTRLYVGGIEACPEKNPLRNQVLPLFMLCTEKYAKKIGCSEIWIIDPHTKITPKYSNLGYKFPSSFKRLITKKSKITNFMYKKLI